jgi:hypothetical protein
MNRINFKRGDTFLLRASVNDGTEDANPVDITGWTIRSQIRDGNTLVDTCTVTITDDAAGEYELLVEDTTEWPTRVLRCDIEYTTDADQITSTETFEICVIRDITI